VSTPVLKNARKELGRSMIKIDFEKIIGKLKRVIGKRKDNIKLDYGISNDYSLAS